MGGPESPIRLILQPAAERSRSMLLYAERLVAHAQPDARPQIFRVAQHRGRVGSVTADLVAPPLVLPRIRGGIAHVVDHAHAGYLRFLRVPALVTVHDLIPLKVLERRYPAAARPQISRRAGVWFRWNIRAVPRARCVVTPSRATAEDLRRVFGDLRVEVVPHGVDPEFGREPDERTRAVVRERLGSMAERRIVLQVTNGFFYKNDAGCAAAIERLCASRADVAWVRVGAPFAADAATACPRLHFDAASTLELAALYREAAVLLFPSWDEGFGWPPLEAMAAGCPVVCSARGALAETAAPAALVVDPGDVQGMAAALTGVLDEPARASDLVARGREHARAYSWDVAARQMGQIWAEVARCA